MRGKKAQGGSSTGEKCEPLALVASQSERLPVWKGLVVKSPLRWAWSRGTASQSSLLSYLGTAAASICQLVMVSTWGKHDPPLYFRGEASLLRQRDFSVRWNQQDFFLGRGSTEKKCTLTFSIVSLPDVILIRIRSELEKAEPIFEPFQWTFQSDFFRLPFPNRPCCSNRYTSLDVMFVKQTLSSRKWQTGYLLISGMCYFQNWSKYIAIMCAELNWCTYYFKQNKHIVLPVTE